MNGPVLNAQTMAEWALVTSVNRQEVLSERLAASPCLQPGQLPWLACFNMPSAGQALACGQQAFVGRRWLIWAHQDVYLPEGWLQTFVQAVQAAERQWPNLAVAGVYGLQQQGGHGGQVVRAGHLLDRGRELREPAALPMQVDSLDELLIALRLDAGLLFDPALGYDFYGTDVVLQAQARGYCAAVVSGYCEHWSDTPQFGPVPARTVARIRASAQAFEAKWVHRLPLQTPCFDIRQPGDVERFLDTLTVHD